MICLPITLRAEFQTCANCKKAIFDDNVVQVDGKSYHTAHFVCDLCGETIGNGQYSTKEHKNYHPACFDKLFGLKCDWCQQVIKGRYLKGEDKTYHDSCYISHVAPRCAYCDKPMIDSSLTSGGKSYHTSCYHDHVAPRCLLCGGVIEGKYMTTFRGGTWHAWHDEQVPQCEFCSAPIDTIKGESFASYSDGRYLCGDCAKSAVTTRDTVRLLADSVSALLGTIGIQVSTEKIRLTLSDRIRLKELSGKELRGFTDFKEYRAAFGLVKDQRLTVYILKGMPRLECIAVLAHDLTHVWMDLHGRVNLDNALCEGSCNYSSLLVLKQYPGAETDFLVRGMLTDPDPIYGQGLRDVKAWVEEVGVTAWVQYLLKNDKPPW